MTFGTLILFVVLFRFKGERENFYHDVPDRYIDTFDEIYQFAADMGGAGFVFTGENDADIMHNSVQINLNVLECQRQMNDVKKLIKLNFLFWFCLHVSRAQST